MKFYNFYRTLSFLLFLSVAGLLGSAEQEAETINKDQQIIEQQEKNNEKINKLAQGLGFLFDEVLNQDFSDSEDKTTALALKYELDSRFDSVSSDIKKGKDVSRKIAALEFLIKLQKIVDAKLEIFLAFDQDNSLSQQKLKSIRLRLCKHFNERIKKLIKCSSHVLLEDNHLITLDLGGFFQERDDFYALKPLLKVDLLNLWPTIYEKYSNLMHAYVDKSNLENFDEEKVDAVLTELNKQKNILSEVKFTQGIMKKIFGSWAGKVDALDVEIGDDGYFGLPQGYYDSYRRDMEEQLKNSIKIFELFILRLIKIKEEVHKTKKLLEKIGKLDAGKKEVMIRNLVLQENPYLIALYPDLNTLKKDAEFIKCFNDYHSVVKEFLNNDKLELNDMFVYRLYCAISNLKTLKSKNEPSGILPILGVTGKNKQTELLCSIIEDMIDILEQVTIQLKTDKSSSSNNTGLVEKILAGEVAIPTKLKNLLMGVFQAAIN